MVVWFLVLHISLLLLWVSALLYLPVMIGTSVIPPNIGESPVSVDSVARFLFTRITTPAALMAIMAGTAVYLIDGNTQPWLIIKLSLVTALVVCHALVGMLILRSERGEKTGLRWRCLTLALIISGLIASIIWIVLAKPSPDLLPGGAL